VVDPDVLCGLDTNGITLCGEDLGNGKVANDYVLDVLDRKTNANELCGEKLVFEKDLHGENVKRTGRAALSNDGLVGAHSDLGFTSDGTRNNDDFGRVAGGSGL